MKPVITTLSLLIILFTHGIAQPGSGTDIPRPLMPSVRKVKQSSDISIRLDSIYFRSDVMEKMEYLYKASGEMISETTSTWNNVLNKWELTRLFEIVYDEMGLEKQHIWKDYIKQNNTWRITWMDEFSYNGEGKPILIISSEWNSTLRKLEKVEKQTYEYFPKAIITISWFPGEAEEWIFGLKKEEVMDDQGNNISSAKSRWNIEKGEWLNESIRIREYNAQHLLINEINNKWDHNSGTWQEVMTFDYAYDVKGLLTEYIQTFTSTKLRETYTYDANDNQVLVNVFKWNNTTSAWDSMWKYEYEFDPMGNWIKSTSYSWQITLWKELHRMTREMDTESPLMSLILPKFSDLDVMVLKATSDTWDGSEWVNFYGYEYFYTELNFTSSKMVAAGKPNIYPNPFHENITIDLSGEPHGFFKLYDLSGRNLMNTMVHPFQSLSLEHLKQGVYIYHLINGSQSYTGKIVKNN
jgi:hypothetical protein